MKSERVVSNPENHGWEEVNGKWIWASGRNTGHIVDGDTEGQIATWHDPSNAWTPDNAVIVDSGTGDATFSGTVNAGNAMFSGRVEVDDFLYADALHVERALDGGGAIYFGPGISKYLFWNPGLGQWDFVGGNVYAPNITTKSGPVISTRDLIETLATLRASTLDETVDVRQALASACDKLIEKFESMQEVATQEVEA